MFSVPLFTYDNYKITISRKNAVLIAQFITVLHQMKRRQNLHPAFFYEETQCFYEAPISCLLKQDTDHMCILCIYKASVR